VKTAASANRNGGEKSQSAFSAWWRGIEESRKMALTETGRNIFNETDYWLA